VDTGGDRSGQGWVADHGRRFAVVALTVIGLALLARGLAGVIS
jgi:hypothetical protein